MISALVPPIQGTFASTPSRTAITVTSVVFDIDPDGIYVMVRNIGSVPTIIGRISVADPYGTVWEQVYEADNMIRTADSRILTFSPSGFRWEPQRPYHIRVVTDNGFVVEGVSALFYQRAKAQSRSHAESRMSARYNYVWAGSPIELWIGVSGEATVRFRATYQPGIVILNESFSPSLKGFSRSISIRTDFWGFPQSISDLLFVHVGRRTINLWMEIAFNDGIEYREADVQIAFPPPYWLTLFTIDVAIVLILPLSIFRTRLLAIIVSLKNRLNKTPGYLLVLSSLLLPWWLHFFPPSSIWLVWPSLILQVWGMPRFVNLAVILPPYDLIVLIHLIPTLLLSTSVAFGFLGRVKSMKTLLHVGGLLTLVSVVLHLPLVVFILYRLGNSVSYDSIQPYSGGIPSVGPLIAVIGALSMLRESGISVRNSEISPSLKG